MKLGIAPPNPQNEYDPLYSWRLSVTEDSGEHLTVFMNDASRYTVVIKGVNEDDGSQLHEIFQNYLTDALLEEQINPDVIDKYIKNAGAFEFVRNVDRQKSSWVNRSCNHAWWAYDADIPEAEISRKINQIHVGTKDEKEYWQPSVRFFELLSAFGLPIKCCDACKFETQLHTQDGLVKREFLVNASITFTQLHRIIGLAYSRWFNHLPFAFTLFENKDCTGKPKKLLYEGLAAFESLSPNEERLNDHLELQQSFLYLPCSGNEMKIYVKLVDVIEDYTDKLPIVTGGEGAAPEDSFSKGVEFETFIDKIINGEHIELLKLQSPINMKPFNKNDINRNIELGMWLH